MRLEHFRPCVWSIFDHAFGAFWVVWCILGRLAHFGQAHWHSLDLRGANALGLSLYYTLFSNL